METGTVIAAIAVGIAGAGLAFTAISVRAQTVQLKLDREMKTLEYVTSQFDRLAALGAREELRRMGDQDIREYTKDDDVKTQKMLEYVYVFNRIGTGIAKGALTEDVIFNIWSPSWFQGHWKTFEPLVRQEKAKRGDAAKGAYVFFEWLATKRCPEVAAKYPAIN